MRYVSIDLSSDNYLEQPQIFGGYAGEHNETILQVKLPERMIDIECSGYRFDFQTSEDNKISSPLIPISELNDGILSFKLSEQLTISGKLLFNVAAVLLGDEFEENLVSLISKTSRVILYIEDSTEGNVLLIDPNGYKDELQQIVDDRVSQIGVAKGEKGDRGEQGIQGEKGDKGDKGEKGDTGAAGKDAVTDQTFDPESENAQSGIAIEERLKSKVLLDVTLTEEQAGASSVDIAIPNFELLKKAKYWHIHFSYPYSGEYAANTIWLNCIIHDINKTAYNSSISSSYNIKMPTSSNKGFLNIIAFNTQYADGMGMLETYYLPHHPWARVSAANSAATPRANNWHYPSYFADVGYPPYLEFTNSNGFIFEAGTRIYLEVIL